jgi:IS30 family transposase
LIYAAAIIQLVPEATDKVALRLNQRPRKTLGFRTPADKLQASVASTH